MVYPKYPTTWKFVISDRLRKIAAINEIALELVPPNHTSAKVRLLYGGGSTTSKTPGSRLSYPAKAVLVSWLLC